MGGFFSGKMMKQVIFVAILLCFFNLGESIMCDSEPKNTEIRLRQKLFCNYDKSMRPVNNFRNKTVVRVKMTMIRFQFHEADEQLQVNSWMALRWKDEGLKWVPEEYANIKIVRELSSDIWIPDFMLFKSDSGQSMDSCRPTQCLIDSDGTVTYITPCSHTGYCESDFSRWPYDRQNCKFTFLTWTNSAEEMAFEIDETTISSKSLQRNAQWKLISTKVDEGRANFSKQIIPLIEFNFILERHSDTHYAVVLAPIYIMILLNLTSFLVQTQSSQRLFLMGLNLMLHFMFIQQLSRYVPQNGEDVPTIIIMLRDSTIITGFLIIFTILLRLIITMDCSPPAWVDKPIGMISSNRIGQVFMSPEIDSKRLDVETPDDSVNLVTSPPVLRPIQIKSSWEMVAKLLNFVVFIILVVIYYIMILALLPEVQEDESTNE